MFIIIMNTLHDFCVYVASRSWW